MKAIIICGSRHWTKLEPIKNVIQKEQPRVVIHGAAAGADTLTDTLARYAAVDVIPMPAMWKRDGRSAGPKRNEEMLKVLLALQRCGYEVAVHAFPLATSKGTVHMMNIARFAGVQIHNHGSIYDH